MESNAENLSPIAHLRKFCDDQCSDNYFSHRKHVLDALNDLAPRLLVLKGARRP